MKTFEDDVQKCVRKCNSFWYEDENDLLVIALCTNYNQIVYPSFNLLYIYMYVANFLITVQLNPLWIVNKKTQPGI